MRNINKNHILIITYALIEYFTVKQTTRTINGHNRLERNRFFRVDFLNCLMF